MKIVIQDYSPQWKNLFIHEKEILSASLPDKNTVIEHIGSTSVEGLGAKPVIDIMIGVDDFTKAQQYINPIVNIGYEYIYRYEDVMPYRRFFIKEKNTIRTHHIHLVEKGTEFWERHLAFRDHLRNDAEDRNTYYQLKKKLAEQEWETGDQYANAKSEFIQAIQTKILNG